MDMGSVTSKNDTSWKSPDYSFCRFCGSQTNMRICPLNHCELPKYIGQVPDFPVYMIGPGQSGKSVYLAVTMKHLRKDVFPSFRSTLDYSTHATEKKIERVEQIIRAGELFPGNKGWRTEPELRQPFMLLSRIHSYVPYFYPLRRMQCANLVLFDTAGEDSKDEAAVKHCYDGFEHAKALVIFIDPKGIRKMQPLLKESDNTGNQADLMQHEYDPISVITRLARVWLDQKRKENTKLGPEAKVSIPTAFVLTKIDELKLNAAGILSKPADHQRGFDMDHCQEMSDALVEHFSSAEINSHEFIVAMQNNFSDFCLFAVSSLGHAPEKVEEDGFTRLKLKHEPMPLHVENPILWILNRFNQFKAW